ncbi:MAG: hypothetical protein HOD63_04070 [Bacteroidetes bacterium]|jgi:hypothetical protein|nr:hypothetical protein [Bacteroidota bacterium]MBT4337740.1 hypothetical protein [Bacteroidota bacterium]MBT5529228.1 hypothetical protein [Cytophagia bacterium]MBT6836838.1 hypothetical protein [Bacteroidota bacterium]
MVKKFSKLKRLLLISSLVLLAFSCKTNKNQSGNLPEVEFIEELELEIIQADTFSGKVPDKLEMEISTDGNDFFEVKHQSADQSKVDSIKNQQNKLKNKRK